MKDDGTRDIDTTGAPRLWQGKLASVGYDASLLLNQSADTAVNRLQGDSVFFFDGHGNWDVISFREPNNGTTSLIVTTDRTLSGRRMVDLPEDLDLSNLQVALFDSCYAAKDLDTEGNIMRAFMDRGAWCTIGFTVTLTTSYADRWAENLAQCAVDDGMEIEAAARKAARDADFAWGMASWLSGGIIKSSEQNLRVMRRTDCTDIRLNRTPGAGAFTDTPATSLVVDVSGSMEEASGSWTKIEAAREAAHTVLDVIGGRGTGGGSRVGVAVFSDDAESLVDPASDFTAVRSAIDNMGTRNMTDMLAGIEVGISQLEGIGTAADKAMFFLSDGLDTDGNSDATILDAARRAASMGIRIYTIGFGDPGTLNEDLLREIARVSGGTYGWADTSGAMALVGQFTKSQTLRSGAQPLFEIQGTVSQGQTVDLGGAVVPDLFGEMQVVVASSGNGLEPQLVDPDGVEVSDEYPGYSLATTDRTAQVYIEGAKPGEWEVAVYGADVSMPEEPFYTLVSFKESTETPPASGGGAPSGSGAEALLLVVGLGAVSVVGWLFIGRKPSPGTAATSAASSSVEFVLVSTSGERHPLAAGAHMIGRANDNDIVVSDPTVSRKHALIAVEKGQITVRDLGSSAGTELDGRRIRDQRTAVKSGSVLAFGDATFTLERSAEKATVGKSPRLEDLKT